MRRQLVAGNWKMNGSRASVDTLLRGVVAEVSELQSAEVLVCAPYVYLPMVQAQLGDTNVRWGAQNVSEHSHGAYTGEVAAGMLLDFGCSHVIVGHSERRALYAESDAAVAKKLMAANEAGMTPVFCVGETLEERESGATEAVVARQLQAVIDLGGVEALATAVMAYEPVWAIGTGKTATPDQAQDVHAFLRTQVASFDETIAADLQILYGGSVKASNAAELFAKPDIDGGLIGGASLDATEFAGICRAAS
jgi:triosephosphate isomerase